MTMFELETLTLNELQAMHRRISAELTRSDPGTSERRNALVSLENVARAINARSALQPPAF